MSRSILRKFSLLKYSTDTFHTAYINSLDDSSVSELSFHSRLSLTMDHLSSSSAKAILLSIPPKQSSLIPEAVSLGFSFQTASPESLTLLLKLKECHLPSPATHAIGGGAVLFSPSLDRIMVVKEKSGPAKGAFKIPTGRIDPGESLSTGILREIDEELSLSGDFLGLLITRDAFPMMYGLSELFFVGVVVADSDKFKVNYSELEDASWLSFEQFKAIGHKHEVFQAACRFIDIVKEKRISSKQELTELVPLKIRAQSLPKPDKIYWDIYQYLYKSDR